MQTTASSRSIATKRLILRPHEAADFPDVRAMWADPAVVEHIYGRAQTDAESWFRLLRYRGHWALLGFGYWAVIDREDRRYLGEVGFADYRREIDPPFDGTPEAGWVMTSGTHGHGLAREAMEAALGWFDMNVAAERTVAMITPENAASIRLAGALGYELRRTSPYNGKTRFIYERPRYRTRTERGAIPGTNG
ncbi:GNAT family N-acetyltransferase [Aestuariibius sp. 2305UL40-4]|uniref:GNAT family N-acetyltransferase n=1 Tax=Aestuariibius violaceus TaxID=3234132 RepID=UPI00398E7198